MQVLCNADALTAVLGCLGSYFGMVLVMTGTPVRMDAVGFSISMVGRTIQVHLLGMFVPGLLTGPAVDAVGPRAVLCAGAAMLCGCVPLLRGADTLPRLMPGLALLGMGWNLAYVASSKLLVSIPLSPSDAANLQAMCEFVTAVGDTTAALLAAVVINYAGWDTLLWLAFPPIVLAALGAAARSCCPPEEEEDTASEHHIFFTPSSRCSRMTDHSRATSVAGPVSQYNVA